MSHTAVIVRPQDYAPPAAITRWRDRALSIGVVAAIAMLIVDVTAGAGHRWDLFLRSWLVGFLFWLGPTTGSLVLLMLQYTSGGNWGRVGRRLWEAAAGNWWLMALCWLPIALGMKTLYPWAGAASDTALAQHYGPDKINFYLNPTFFWIRGVVYFAGWALLY